MGYLVFSVRIVTIGMDGEGSGCGLFQDTKLQETSVKVADLQTESKPLSFLNMSQECWSLGHHIQKESNLVN
jgi:hypothetical protein